MKDKHQFQYMRRFIRDLVELLGGRKGGPFLAELYSKFWNPINYALIGGIGVIINYFVWLILITFTSVPWFFVNALAIVMAWSWNWANSVGPLGWAWGFKKRKVKE